MVALPSIENNVPQVRAPTPAVSPADIAAPYASLARSLDLAGETVEKVIAEPAAESAGRKAVTIGSDGQPIIARAPIFGAASAHYMRAAMFTALADTEPQVQSKLTEMRLAYPNDPAGYQTAATEYIKKFTAGIPDEGLREAVKKSALSHAGANYRTTLVQADNTNRENALVSLQARLAGINEQGASIARQGGVDTPEYAQLHADRAAIYGELVSDPRFKFPQAKVDEQLKENRDADVAQGVIGEVLRTYKTKANSVEAQRALQDAFWGPGSENLSLSPQKRDKAVTEGLRALERTGAEDKQATAAFQAVITKYSAALQHDPGNYSDIAHGALESKAAEVDPTGKLRAELSAAKTMVPLWQGIKGLPPSEANAVLASIARGVVPALPTKLRDRGLQAQIEAEATRQGVPANLAVTIAQIESSGNPGAVTGSYKGLFQLSDAEFAQYGPAGGNIMDPAANTAAGIASLKAKAAQFKADFGRDPTATELYLAHQQGEAGLRAHLANPDAPAWQNMLSTGEGKQKGEAWAKAAIWGNLPQSAKAALGSVENVSSAQFMAAWAQRVQGIPYGESGLSPGQLAVQVRNPYVAKLFFSTAEQMRVEVGRNAETMATQISAMAKARDPIPAETLQTFVTAAIGSGKEELLAKVRPELEAYDAARAVQQGGGGAAVPAMQAQITAIKAGGVDPIKHEMLNSLSAQLTAGAEGMEKAPLTEAARRGWVDPIHPIDAGNPQVAAAELAERNGKIAVARNRDATLGPMKAIGDDEAQGIKTALTQGDPAAAAGLLGALRSSLSPENYKATLSSKPMREALDGMVRSYDPVRLNAAMATLDEAWRTDPVGFNQTFHEETARRLQTWQAHKDSLTPDQMVEFFKRADDPAVKTAREKLTDEAGTKIKSVTAANVADFLGSWADGAVPLVHQSPPVESIQGGVLLAEYDRLFKERYVDTGDAGKAKEQAVERLKTVWGASALTGGALMRHPPEKYYPQVDGSHDWMRRDIEAGLTAVMGRPPTELRTTMDAGPMAGDIAMPATNYRYRLTSDAITEADVAAKRPPSYNVVVINPTTGALDAPLDPAGKPMRFRFDQNAAQSEARAGFGVERARRLVNETVLPGMMNTGVP
jgi:hypothetical protein